ncbi:MAG: hypothetical protein ABR976_11530 [Terracidiphilus sp.]
MRTTLTIDDDIATLVEQEVKRSGDSFKGTVNRLLREGLMASREPAETRPFEITPIAMGLKPGLSYDRIAELLEEAEGPYYR